MITQIANKLNELIQDVVNLCNVISLGYLQNNKHLHFGIISTLIDWVLKQEYNDSIIIDDEEMEWESWILIKWLKSYNRA